MDKEEAVKDSMKEADDEHEGVENTTFENDDEVLNDKNTILDLQKQLSEANLVRDNQIYEKNSEEEF